MKILSPILLAAALAATACSPGPQRAAKPPASSVIDDAGRTVAFARSPQRVASLAPSATELLYALGCGGRVVGVTSWCNYPPQARRQPVIGDAVSFNAERLLALRPDAAVMVGTAQSPALAKLEALGIPVIVLDPKSPSDVIHDVQLLGAGLQCGAVADSLSAGLRDSVAAFERGLSLVTELKRPTAFAEIGINPLYTASDSSFLGRMIALAGGRNVAGRLPQGYAAVNAEAVIAADPDVILVLHPMARSADVRTRIGWAGISAVRSGRVYDNFDLDVVLRPGPRFVQGLRALHLALYAQRP